MFKDGFGIKQPLNGWYAIKPNQTKPPCIKQMLL